MKCYYLKSFCLTAGGDWSETYLAKNNEDQVAWVQPFNRSYCALDFISPSRALEYLRDFMKERTGEIYLDENETKVMLIEGNQVVPLSITITTDW